LRIALAAQLGADLMMREMTGVQCAGREGPVGINNWYALGQVYAFLGGSLVFDDYLFKKHVTFTIAQLAAAMVLQGRGPDPTYFQGILAGSYNLLNGLVKGRFRARLTIGDDCQFVEETNTEEKLNLIIAVNPDPAANTEVPNDINPEVEFMFPVGQIFMLPNTNGDNDYYRFEVLQAQLGSSEGAVAGVAPYANGRNTLRFVPDALLEPFTTYLFSVRVEVKERRGGTWQTLLENGQPVIIDTVVTFTTGAADSILLLSNISAAYPVPGQQNFHVDEFSQGYLQLEKWQPDLLDNRDVEVVMEQDGQTFLEKVILDPERKTIAFSLPNLQTGVVTRLQLKDRGNSRELFAFEFRTSNYRTFSEKMATTQRISRQKEGAQFSTDHYLTDEFPDEIDFGQLWKLEVALDDPWYRQFTEPILYTQYPNDYFNAQHEDPDIGFPPVEAVRIQENKNDNTFVITNGFYQMVEQDFYLFKTMVVDYLSEFLRSIDRTDVIDREGGIRPGAQEQFKELLPEDKRYILDLYSATYLAPAIPSPGYLIHY
ncbi:MAG: hypothetical protein KDC57_18050, partial [Saprospiraceae bacterium]|nr:hypothetical protein [Saprospiraceae bacterium]